MRNVNATFIQQAYTHYTINIKCINYTGLPKYIYIYLLLQVVVNLWESEIGITGLVFVVYFYREGILFLVDDGVSLKMAFGGFKAGLDLPILLFLESLQPVNLLFTIYM